MASYEADRRRGREIYLPIRAMCDEIGIHFRDFLRDEAVLDGLEPSAKISALSSSVSPLERAMSLLRSEPLGFPDVAEAVGFSDQSQFTTIFKHSVGVTPGAYRRSVR